MDNREILWIAAVNSFGSNVTRAILVLLRTKWATLSLVILRPERKKEERTRLGSLRECIVWPDRS
jgi:hypothetical protein